MVRAKFKVDQIARHNAPQNVKDDKGNPVRDEKGNYPTVPGEKVTLTMSPVYSTDPNHENKAFWDASPGGSLTLNVVNKAASDQFELGKEYYVDFTPAP